MTEQTSTEMSAQSAANRQIATLDSKIQELEMRLYNLEGRIPNSNIMSNKFWTRALAIFGHEISIYLLFYGGIIAMAVVIGILGALIGSISR